MFKKNREMINLIILIAIVTSLHYFTVSQKWAIHDFYRRLYYIPIIIAAFKFKLKGGIITSSIITLLYFPHVLFYWGIEDIQFINQILEMAMFLFIGSITGYLVEQLSRNNKLLQDQLKRITEIEVLNENIQNSMSNSLIAMNLENEIQIANKTCNVVFPELERGARLNEINTPLTAKIKEILSLYNKEDRKFFSQEFQLKVNSTHYIYNAKVYPLNDHNELTKGTVIVIEDTTDVNRLEEEVRRSEKLSAIGILASGIAHEIRNPLAIIKTIAQTINSDLEDSKIIEEGLDIIIEEVNRANNVVLEVLDFSKVEKGVILKCNIRAIVLEIVNIAKKHIEQNKSSVRCEIDPTLFAKLDKEKIKQVLLNLLLNALDAMPDGGEIEINGYTEDQLIILEIIDSGRGILPENLEKIFSPFYTTRDEGTGLGLSIAHKIIKAHSGRLSVDSTIGESTKFIIELPVFSEGDINEE